MLQKQHIQKEDRQSPVLFLFIPMQMIVNEQLPAAAIVLIINIF